MKKLYVCLSLLVFACFYGNAQTTIRGKVVSDIDEMPLPGVSILLKSDNSKGTTTDFDGNFELNLAVDTGILVFSYLGFDTQEVPFDGSQTLDITLQEGAGELDEVLLIGYGSTKKGDLTSAISTVEGIADIAQRPVRTLGDFLQGNVAGVTVLQQGGDPTQEPQINIRGISSFNASGPLTVVDGVPYYGPAINPNDIESVSILKDASSAAIYGAQAQGGVILITTKSGKQGKPKVQLDFYGGIQEATHLPTPLNAKQQADTYNLAADNAGVSRQSAHDPAQNPWGQTTRTNWMDAVFRSAAIYNLNASVSGASEKARYATSFGYNKKEGVLVGTQSNRYSFRLKTDYDVTNKLTVGGNVYYSLTEANSVNTSSGYSGTIINAIYMPAAAPVYDEEGNFHGTAPFDLSDFAGAYGDVYNPVALLLRPTIHNPTTFLDATAFLNYDILEGLSFKTTYNNNREHWEYKYFDPKRPELGRTKLSNGLSQRYSNTNRWLWDNQLTYKKSFGLHNLELTAIHSAYYEKYEYFSTDAQGFSSEEPYNQYIGNAEQITGYGSNAYEIALASAIGRVMYNYANTYYFSGSIRRDESSKLAVENQSDIFPSASAGWRISKENFFKVNWIDDLKLRASWGQVGNVNALGAYPFDVPLSNTTVILGGGGDENPQNNTPATYEGTQSNPNLTWETSESTDIGLDAYMFNNRLSLTLDYFKKSTKHMIFDGLEDLNQGTNAAKVNGGNLQNTGFEASLSYADKVGELGFTVRANASFLDNKLINLTGYNDAGVNYVYHNDNVRSILTPYRSQVGQQIYSYYLVPYLGIFQNQGEIDAYTHDGKVIQPNARPGDFKFADTNSDGTINEEDKVFMGSYLPDFTYALNLNFDYKGFDLGLFFQGVSGSKAFNGYKYSTYNAALQGYNLDNRVLNAWSETNTHTDIPIISRTDNNQNFGTTSSWYLEDSSYLRLKNVNIGYTFDNSLMPKGFEASSLRVFISADNVFTLTNYSGLDPEVGGKGLDVGRYPVSRIITGGLSLSF